MLALVQATRFNLPTILALVLLGAAALAVLFLVERRVAEPVLPLRLWRRRVLALSNLGGAGGAASYMAVTALLPTYVQGVMGCSPRLAGLVVGAGSVSWMFASIVAGRLMVRTSYRLTAAIGGAHLVAGGAVLVALGPGGGALWPAAGSLLLGIGMGFGNTTFLVAIQGAVEVSERGVATGSQMFMRMIGMSVGAALYGAILNAGVQRHVPGAGAKVNQLLDAAARQHLGPEQLARLAEAVAISAHGAFIVALAIAAAVLALNLCFPRRLSPIHASDR